MSCATSPECEIDRVLCWPTGKKWNAGGVSALEKLELCTGHSAERTSGLELADKLGRNVSRLEARMAAFEAVQEAVGEENVIELKKRRKRAP